MAKEKIYFEEGDVSVTASRVVLGDDNFVLRNISAVKVASRKLKLIGYGIGGYCSYLGATTIISKDVPWGSGGKVVYSFEPGALVFFAMAGAALYFLKDNYFVQVSSGGTPSNTLKSEDSELPTRVVDAINEALLDLDKNKSSQEDKTTQESSKSEDSTDKIMKLKGLLDAGAITQEEFDAKKKELLGL